MNSNMLTYETTLYPEIEPYETGMLDVGAIAPPPMGS